MLTASYSQQVVERAGGAPVLARGWGGGGVGGGRGGGVRTRWGMGPAQSDYPDFRTVAGVKIPFHRTVSQTYMRMDVELSEIRPNVAIDAALFTRPRAVPRG